VKVENIFAAKGDMVDHPLSFNISIFERFSIAKWNI